MARDPYSWADDYQRSSIAQGEAARNRGQQMLMSMFATEARRQQPYNDLPVDLALQNNQYDQMFRNQTTVQQMKADAKAAQPVPVNKVTSGIISAAKRYGVDPDVLLTLAEIESGFNPAAQNPKSSAGGLFQFIDSTWGQYGNGGDRLNPDTAADAGARLARDNALALQKAGLPVNAGTLYLAHQQGIGGAMKLLSNPDAPAADIVGAQAVRLNGGRTGMTAGQFAKLWMDKAERLYGPRAAARNKNKEQISPYDVAETLGGSEPTETEQVDPTPQPQTTPQEAAKLNGQPKTFRYGDKEFTM